MKTNLSKSIFLFAHGAGAGIESEFMQSVSTQLNQSGLKTLPFDFPYMKIMQESGKRRPPDRMPKLIEAFKNKIEWCQSHYPNKKIVVGGKSMGGRVASLVTSELESETTSVISACICLGFPFHPPKKLDKFRGAHLAELSTPTLILQGERDLFGTREEVCNYQLSNHVQVKYLADGDHSFKPRVRSGLTLDENIKQSVIDITHFVASI